MFKITEQLANTILNYLASRPYVEVANMIAGLQRLERLQETKDNEKQDDDEDGAKLN